MQNLWCLGYIIALRHPLFVFFAETFAFFAVENNPRKPVKSTEITNEKRISKNHELLFVTFVK